MASSVLPRVVVTGHSGFVGGWLLRALKGRAEVLPLFAEGIAEGGDIRDRDAVRAAVLRLRPDAVIHLAAIAAPQQAAADRGAAFDVNLTGTLNIAEALRAHASTARLVFVGSSEAYGLSFNDSAAPIGEDVALKPASTYGATKAAADLVLAQMAREGQPILRFRPFNHSGPGQSDLYVASAFARQIAAAELGQEPPVVKVGDLDVERDFLDVRDVVEAYALAALGDAAPGADAVFNLSTGRPVAIRTILETLVAAARIPITVETDPARVRPSLVPRASGDPSRARERLGWQATTPLAKTLGDVLADWRTRLAAR